MLCIPPIFSSHDSILILNLFWSEAVPDADLSQFITRGGEI